MTGWKSYTHSGWGHTSATTAPTARPERLRELLATPLSHSGPLLAVGMNRSYGDAAVPAPGGQAVLMQKMDRFTSFNPENGLLEAEAGVTFGEIVRTFLPHRWMLPVTPGTSFVTLGGAIANDVHGKNHEVNGTLGRHIAYIDLLLPSGELRRLTRNDDADLFAATIGGLGLTGIIVRAGLFLQPVAGGCVQVEKHRCHDLDDMFAAFDSTPAPYDHTVAWIDALARGSQLGRGVYERGHYVAGPLPPPERQKNMPVYLPGLALNHLSIKAFNALYYRLAAQEMPRTQVISAMKFLYPLDSITNWNRMYGRRGFHQFQCLIPQATAFAGIRQLLESISRSGRGSFLAVLKRMGAEGEGLLSFPMPGYTLALDFPNSRGVEGLMRQLIDITRGHGGRIYLAKDSQITADDFAAMYPRLPAYIEALHRADPSGQMSSLLAQRLGLRGRTAA